MKYSLGLLKDCWHYFSITCESGCLLPEVVDAGWGCVGACFHNCIWRSVLLIKGKRGGDQSVRWGEDQLTTGSLNHKIFSSGNMSNNWDIATEKVEKEKKKGRKIRQPWKKWRHFSLKPWAFSFHSFSFLQFLFFLFFFFHLLTCKG